MFMSMRVTVMVCSGSRREALRVSRSGESCCSTHSCQKQVGHSLRCSWGQWFNKVGEA